MRTLGRVLMVVVLVGVVFGSVGCFGPSREEILAGLGKVYVNVRTEPSGAKVYCGEIYYGETPLQIYWNVSVQQYNSGQVFQCNEIQVYLEGYIPGRKSFLLILYPDERETYYSGLIALEPDPLVAVRPTPRPQMQQSQQVIIQQLEKEDETTAEDLRQSLDFVQRSMLFNKLYGK